MSQTLPETYHNNELQIALHSSFRRLIEEHTANPAIRSLHTPERTTH